MITHFKPPVNHTKPQIHNSYNRLFDLSEISLITADSFIPLFDSLPGWCLFVLFCLVGKRALPVHTFAQAQPMKNLLKIINLVEAFHQKSIRSSRLIMMQKSKVVPYYKILHRGGGHLPLPVSHNELPSGSPTSIVLMLILKTS